ncbi:MAG: polysaccharide deacetylase family protein [Bacteroidales bacterium]|nr:polysaccharide deacetylase family protein [Bacteroidales bacterium]
MLNFIAKSFYPSYFVWDFKTNNKDIYLTFDDGPIPEFTPFILDCLASFNVKATFFCTGVNIEKHPSFFKNILNQGHSVGNHTFSHLNGWKTPLDNYIEDVEKCYNAYHSKIFRPPYGRITRAQANILKQKYKIIMWSVLTYDFSAKTSPEMCLKNAVNNSKNGSVVVFHDNLKSMEKVKYALPLFIKGYLNKGFCFKVIE